MLGGDNVLGVGRKLVRHQGRLSDGGATVSFQLGAIAVLVPPLWDLVEYV